jgi:hypothetical protein
MSITAIGRVLSELLLEEGEGSGRGSAGEVAIAFQCAGRVRAATRRAGDAGASADRQVFVP